MPVNAAVLGNAAEFEKVKDLWKGRAETVLKCITSFAEIKEHPGRFSAVIFCEDSYGEKKIIEDIQYLPSQITAMLYSEKANSIIGSRDKNSNGFFIAKSEQGRRAFLPT
jgi:hypothetical protein